MTPDQYEDVDRAILAYWTARDEARIAQEARGVIDQGARAGVTSGGHLDRIAQLLARACRDAGAPADQVCYKAPEDDPYGREGVKTSLTLPGYFRPTKDWDLVVWHAGNPIVVVELKSQNGPSYGNNANNRAEEAIGNAFDLHRAVQKGLVPHKPWVGYAFVIEDDERSRREGGERTSGNLAVDPLFSRWSYTERIRHLSARLVDESLYDEAWPVATSRPTCPQTGDLPERPSKSKCPQQKAGIMACEHEFAWRELDHEGLGYGRFVDSMTAVVKQFYKS